MEILTKRSVSAKTTISQISATSSTNDFVNAKIASISADLALNVKFRSFFEDARKRKAFTDEEFDDSVRELASDINKMEHELVTLKRQKAISDDIDEALPQRQR